MSKIYENQYLGAFIYALGLYAGIKKGQDALNAISLVQQTPLDTAFSDLFVAWGGRSFIFEFKSEEKLARKEYDKEAKSNLISAINANENIKQLADKSHFMCYPMNLVTGNKLFIQIYSTVKNDNSQANTARGPIDLTIFDFLENPKKGLNIDELKTYCNFMINNGGQSSKEISGLIVNIDKTGRLNFVTYGSVLELEIKYEKVKELNEDKGIKKSSYLDFGM